MIRAVALREDQYRTSRDADAKAARSPEFCAAAYAVRAAASSASIRVAPSGVTSFGGSEIDRSGSSSTASSCSFTKALLIGCCPLLSSGGRSYPTRYSRGGNSETLVSRNSAVGEGQAASLATPDHGLDGVAEKPARNSAVAQFARPLQIFPGDLEGL